MKWEEKLHPKHAHRLRRELQRILATYHRAYRNGDKSVVLRAVTLCGRHSFLLPAWVTGAVTVALHEWTHYEVRELGKAFGMTREKGERISDRHRRAVAKWAVWLKVRERHKDGEPITEALFEKVAAEVSKELSEELGKECEIGKTVAAELYYEVDKLSSK